MIRRAARVAAVAFITIIACAADGRYEKTPDQYLTQIPLPPQGDPWTAIYPGRQDVAIHLTPGAAETIRGLAHASLALRVELAACVVRFRIMQGHAYVPGFSLGDTVRIAVDSIAKARPFWSDSLQIRAPEPLCAEGVPVLHTHLVPNPWLFVPSPVDVASAEARSAPFDLLLSVASDRVWLVTAYGMRRAPRTP